MKENSIGSEKKNSSFPDSLREEPDTEFCPCVSCVTTNFKRISRDVYEKCCLLIQKKKSLTKGEYNKWYNTEIKIAKREMRYAVKKYMQDKTNEPKHKEFRRLRHFKM